VVIAPKGATVMVCPVIEGFELVGFIRRMFENGLFEAGLVLVIVPETVLSAARKHSSTVVVKPPTADTAHASFRFIEGVWQEV